MKKKIKESFRKKNNIKKILIIFLVLILVSIPILFFYDKYFIVEYGKVDRGPICNYDSKDRIYVAKDPVTCQKVRYGCDDIRRTHFFDSCGCGCELKDEFK